MGHKAPTGDNHFSMSLVRAPLPCHVVVRPTLWCLYFFSVCWLLFISMYLPCVKDIRSLSMLWGGRGNKVQWQIKCHGVDGLGNATVRMSSGVPRAFEWCLCVVWHLCASLQVSCQVFLLEKVTITSHFFFSLIFAFVTHTICCSMEATGGAAEGIVGGDLWVSII